MTLINEIQGKNVVINILRVSGTIKKAELEGIRRANEELMLVKDLEEKERDKME